jgi:hypothetical protein
MVHQAHDIEKIIHKTWISVSVLDCKSNSDQNPENSTLLKIKFFDSRRIGVLANMPIANEFSILELNHYTPVSYRIVENKIKTDYVEYEIFSVCHDTLKLILRDGNTCLKYIMLEESAYESRIRNETVPKFKSEFLENFFIDPEDDTIRLFNSYFSPLLLKENRIDRKQRRELRRFLKRSESNYVLYKMKLVVKDDGSLKQIEFLNKKPEEELEELLRNMIFDTAVKWQPVEIDGLYYHSAVNWYLYINFKAGKYILLDPFLFPSLDDPELYLDDINFGLFFIQSQ